MAYVAGAHSRSEMMNLQSQCDANVLRYKKHWPFKGEFNEKGYRKLWRLTGERHKK